MGRETYASAKNSATASGYVGETMRLTVPPETDANVERLARLMGVSKAEVFSKALALLSVAVEAHREGKAVGIAPTAEVLETEFVGLCGASHARTVQEGRLQ